MIVRQSSVPTIGIRAGSFVGSFPPLAGGVPTVVPAFTGGCAMKLRAVCRLVEVRGAAVALVRQRRRRRVGSTSGHGAINGVRRRRAFGARTLCQFTSVQAMVACSSTASDEREAPGSWSGATGSMVCRRRSGVSRQEKGCAFALRLAEVIMSGREAVVAAAATTGTGAAATPATASQD
ncbi:hypothetical protein EJB05_07194 [Eragrostis curvula]|uniref:Uncharacterized protein n=1 Tax=Eragrostis curvula TaxID=38414 RepID=A0A5J9WHA9_9POAL|nr:hypothetical protein EJB05_07194 [Eragrostis curvula]